MTQIDDKALEAAVLAHDKEEAAMRGEPDPWADERPDGEFSDRKAAMALAIRAYLSAAASDVSGLVERLQKIAGPVRMENGSFSDIAYEAATTLEAQAAELAAVKEMYAREGAKALYELERAERAEARLAEALKALEKSENLFEAISHHIDEHSFSFAKGFCSQGAFTARRVREGGKVK